MSYGLIARGRLHMISLPEDFDLQMMSGDEFNDLLNNPIHRVEGLNRKLAIDLVDDVGDYIIGKDYNKIHKLEPHEAKILLDDIINETSTDI